MAVSSLLLALFFVVGALRVTTTRSDVSSAARAAARAAAQSYDAVEASEAATNVASAVLADRGVACRDLQVDVSDDYSAGAIVTATVRCSVELDDVALVGFPGREDVSATAAEMVDVVRGGG